jgi:hypothetical protein
MAGSAISLRRKSNAADRGMAVEPVLLPIGSTKEKNNL